MGLFSKSKKIEIHPHEVLRKDWENVLAALFRSIIANSVEGVAIICNTCRKDEGDGEGSVQKELIYHIRQKRMNEVESKLKKMDGVHFADIFKNYLEGDQKGQDFYRIKNILANEIMVYPLLQGGTKKAILIVDYPLDESRTVKIMQIINDIFHNSEIQSVAVDNS